MRRSRRVHWHPPARESASGSDRTLPASVTEIVINRRGRAAARLSRAEASGVRFPDRSVLRAELPFIKESASEAIRALREEERY